MRTDIPAAIDPTLVSRAGVSVTLYVTGTPYDLIVGTPDLLTVDLTPLVERVSHKSASATLTVTHAGELAGANRPRRGQSIELKVGGHVVWRGVVGSYAEDEERGTRHGTITARRRDALPAWREARRMTPVFTVGTDLGVIARSVAEALGLERQEYVLPNTGISLVHDSAQIADVNAWEMLRTILEPGLRAPFVDGRGILRSISRDVRRAPVLEVPAAQIVRFGRASSGEGPSTVRVRWLDPNLSKVTQQERVLATETLTAGFFKWHERKEVWWSDDHTLRAEDTRFVVKASINDGLLHIGSERYAQTTEHGGEIETEIDAFVPTLAGAALAALYASHQIPEPVQVGPTGSGTTVPWYKAAAVFASETTLWLAVMSIGQGIYEVWGVPFDYVHAIHEVEAYDEEADPHVEAVDEIENNFIPNGVAAETLAVAELVYRSRAAEQDAVVIADDLRIEPGDVLSLGGAPYYVLDYGRDLSRGASAELKLEGFFV